MRDLKVYIEKAMKEIDSINVPYSKYVTDWKINDRAKKRWGQCTKLEKKIGNEPTFEIQICKTLLEENNDESGLLTVIIHELLHTCKGGMTHKGKWKYYADIVTSKLGYTLTRTNSKEELGISEIPKELQSMPKSVNFRFKSASGAESSLRDITAPSLSRTILTTSAPLAVASLRN